MHVKNLHERSRTYSQLIKGQTASKEDVANLKNKIAVLTELIESKLIPMITNLSQASPKKSNAQSDSGEDGLPVCSYI